MASGVLLSRRNVNIAGALICIGMLAFGYYLQFVQGLAPCVLCIFQRLALVGLVVVFAVAALHNPRGLGRWIYTGLLTVVTAIGVALAGRHIWLQNLSEEEKMACGAGGWNYLMDVFGLTGTLARAWRGTGDCTEVVWTFLTLSIPAWTLIAFVVVGGIGIIRNARA